MSDFRKNILQTVFERKKILQGNTCHTMALYVRGKILSPKVWEKNSYANQITYVPPAPFNLKWFILLYQSSR